MDGVSNNRNREGESHSDGGGIQDVLNVRCLWDTQVTQVNGLLTFTTSLCEITKEGSVDIVTKIYLELPNIRG